MIEWLTYWWFRVVSALRWYFGASTRYDVHSPFLSQFVAEVYRDRRQYHAFGQVADLREYWSGQHGRSVTTQTLGAPSRIANGDQRSVVGLVRSSAVGVRQGKFLFRLALWTKPRRIVEFGTNAGLSTLYLHLADRRVPLDTVEGNAEVAALARESFGRMPTGETLTAHTGSFEEWLATDPIPSTPLPTLFFLDGDHRYQPTLDYVEKMLARANPDSIFVVADIHWSAGMERAWQQLQRHPRVTASIDTYHFGLLFFRPELQGPHLSIIPTRYKPWRVGFF